MHHRCLPSFSDLGSFLSYLDRNGQLQDVGAPVSTRLELTEIHRRVIAAKGPALRLTTPIDDRGVRSAFSGRREFSGTRERVAWGLGTDLHWAGNPRRAPCVDDIRLGPRRAFARPDRCCRRRAGPSRRGRRSFPRPESGGRPIRIFRFFPSRHVGRGRWPPHNMASGYYSPAWRGRPEHIQSGRISDAGASP